ncbi:MAG: hypothetical protein E7521_04200 [Ruminococcaceae bacterium]|nr:hypothetical protein [Oscillospiraceae bacterium]
MNNIMNYAKKSLSITLVLAILAISLFTGVSVNVQATDVTSDTWDGTYSEPTTTDDAGNVIITNAEELAWVVLKSGAAGAGKTYKVNDGIKSFYMNENAGELTLEQVKNQLNGNNINSWDYQSNPFQATLDGNGVTIYGLYSEGANSTAGAYGGLVPVATGTVAVKNLAIKNSYIGGYKYSSAIIGYANDDNGLISLTVEQCVVTNNYIIQTRTATTNSGANYSVGAIGGGIDAHNDTEKRYVKVNNCLVYGNELYSALGGNISGIFAYFRAKSSLVNGEEYYKFTNLIISGAAPWSGIDNSPSRDERNFVNVYTDTDMTKFTYDGANTGSENGYGVLKAGSVELLETANMQGAAAESNMQALDWENTWTTTENGFPELKLFYNEPTTDDGEQDTLNIVYWDGTKTAPDETNVDSNGNIIILTAAELNYIANTASSGKSYKIADGIDVMILQPKASVDAETLMGFTDYNAVKTYLTETITATAWCNYSSDPPVFNGSFDGNGVEIYGLYGTGNNVGLFPGIDGGTVYTTDGHTGNTFQNFALRNSYLESSRRIGVIGAYCAGGIGVGTVNVKNCEVSNCYIANSSATASYFAESGLLVGRTYAKEFVHIDNCLVYGNYSYAIGLDKQIPLYSGAYTSDANAINTVNNSLILGTTPYPTYSSSSKTHTVNSFENVYTDQELSTYTTYADTDMKKVDVSAIKGDDAATQMPGLDWTNTWITVEGKYPALRLFYESSSSGGSGESGGEEPEEPEDPEIPEDIQDCATNIIYWDNTVTDSTLADKGEKGTAEDPIIIDSAEELNYLALRTTPAASTGKHYKMADGIDAVILQPKATVDAMGGAAKIMNITSGSAVNTYFSNMQSAGYTPANWISTPNATQFNGSFDGNGIKIYGLYASVASQSEYNGEAASLFPVIDGGGTTEITDVEIDLTGVYYKNIAIRNSYFSSYRRVGALTGIAFGTNYGAKVQGTINIDAIEVSNCYMRATATADGENGVLAGNLDTDLANISNCLVYGNDTLWNQNGTTKTLTLVGSSASILTGENVVVENTFKDSLILGTKPQPQYPSDDFNYAKNVENIYTDQDISALVTKYGYTDEDMIKLTGSTAEAIGTEIGTGLNRTGKWITSEGGMPSLLPFHDAIEVVSSDNTTHSIKCGCGITTGTVSHIYDDNYKCVQCNYQHVHNMVDAGVVSDADCVVGGVMNTKCDSCDYTSTREIPSGGHQFSSVVAATAGDCKTEATVAYKTCSVCGLQFAENADIHSDKPLEHIGTGYTGRHNWVEQDALTSECGGVDPIPYFQCSVCDAYLVEGVMTGTKPSEIDGHTASGNYYIDENTHANICVTCGDTFNEQTHSDTNDDSICDVCYWPCGEHVFEGASITLTDSIAVNYMVEKSVVDVLGYENLYIQFTFRGKDYTVSKYTESGEYYVFTFDKIAPHRMTDIIYANLCGTKDGATYTSKTSEYSVERYCYNMLEKYSDDAQLRTLLVDLLNYGAESQMYTDYNTDSLANADLTDVQKAWGTSADIITGSVQNLKYKVIDNPSVKWKGAGLYLDEAATLRFTIQADNINNLVVKATCGTTTIEIPASQFAKISNTDNRYYVYVSGINVTKMRDTVQLTVFNGETEVSNTITYSVESYANVKIGGSDNALSNLLIAMMKYGDAAKAYLDAQ